MTLVRLVHEPRSDDGTDVNFGGTEAGSDGVNQGTRILAFTVLTRAAVKNRGVLLIMSRGVSEPLATIGVLRGLSLGCGIDLVLVILSIPAVIDCRNCLSFDPSIWRVNSKKINHSDLI